jgi:hypothetical protein
MAGLEDGAERAAPRRGGRRRHGEGTIYFDAGAGLWRGELMVGRRANGRRDTRKVSTKTQRECRAKLLALRQQHATGVLTEPGLVTVAAFFADWLETYVRRRSPATYVQYESLLRNHLLPALGTKRLRDLQSRHLQELYNALETGDRRAGYARHRPPPGLWHVQGLAPTSVRNLHVAVHAGL